MAARFVISGTDTGIGKTVFSAALAVALNGCYWKPVQSGLDGETDSETVARLGLDITVVVFNDRTLSLIKVKQKADGHGGLGAVQYAPTDFAAVARGMGVAGVRTESLDALRAALATSGPLLVDVPVDPDSYRHVLEVTRFAAT